MPAAGYHMRVIHTRSRVALAACLMVMLVFGYYGTGLSALAWHADGTDQHRGGPHMLVVPAGQFGSQMGSGPGERPGTWDTLGR